MIVDKKNNLKKCSKCEVVKKATEDNFYYQDGRPHGKCKKCQKSKTERSRRRDYHRKVRMEALMYYGGEIPECKCCGEKEIKFLGIDHVNGGGTKHRKKIAKKGLTMYLWLRKNEYPEGFQAFCHNCNLAKGFYGQCPHKIIKT